MVIQRTSSIWRYGEVRFNMNSKRLGPSGSKMKHWCLFPLAWTLNMSSGRRTQYLPRCCEAAACRCLKTLPSLDSPFPAVESLSTLKQSLRQIVNPCLRFMAQWHGSYCLSVQSQVVECRPNPSLALTMYTSLNTWPSLTG